MDQDDLRQRTTNICASRMSNGPGSSPHNGRGDRHFKRQLTVGCEAELKSGERDRGGQEHVSPIRNNYAVTAPLQESINLYSKTTVPNNKSDVKRVQKPLNSRVCDMTRREDTPHLGEQKVGGRDTTTNLRNTRGAGVGSGQERRSHFSQTKSFSHDVTSLQQKCPTQYRKQSEPIVETYRTKPQGRLLPRLPSERTTTAADVKEHRKRVQVHIILYIIIVYHYHD